MNRDVLRSPGPASPRNRPSGPRTLSRRPQAQSYKPFPSTELPDESAPAYSGHNSPSASSYGGSTSASPLAAVFTPEQLPVPLAGVLHEEPEHVEDVRGCREQGTQTEGMTPTPTRVSTPVVRLVVKQPTLTPPAAVTFETSPVSWRGMTMESAQWTLTSVQLQEVVSRAIRKTAAESFIRLLSVKVLDEELTAELERLDTVCGHSHISTRPFHAHVMKLKATTQSQYRFNMHRRTMLLQSLLALGTGAGDHDPGALYSLTTQLADLTAACDRLMEELLRVADQKAQITHLIDVHDTSALAMALRKLNASYAKRTTELREARQANTQLKRELEEAWTAAHEMAEEMDALDDFQTGFSSDEDTGNGDETKRIDDSVRLAEVIGITGRAVATKATLTNMEAQGVDTESTKSGSARGKERDRQMDRTQWVEKAKKRSSIASKASLRLPKSSKSPAAETRSISSRMSKKRSLRRMSIDPKPTVVSPSSSVPAAPVPPPAPPVLQIDTQEVHNVRKRKDSSFLDFTETRQVSPVTPTTNPIPPVPIPNDIVSRLESSELGFNVRSASADPSLGLPEQPPTEARGSHSQQPSFDFSIPGYDTSIGSSPGSLLSAGEETRPRRVHSVLVVDSLGRKSLDDSGRGGHNEGANLKRSASDYRKVDAWPFAGRVAGTSSRRLSMPFSGTNSSSSLVRLPIGAGSSNESINSSHRPTGQNHIIERPISPASRARSPVPRVFSPPPRGPSMSPVSTKSANGILTESVPPRVFSPPPRVFSTPPSTYSASSSSSLSGSADPVTPSPVRVFSPKPRLMTLTPTDEAVEEPLETPKMACPPPYAEPQPAATLTFVTAAEPQREATTGSAPFQPPRVFSPRPPPPLALPDH